MVLFRSAGNQHLALSGKTMTNTPIRDADVSVLTLPREDPLPTRQPQPWLRWLTAGVAAAFLLVVLYWYTPRSSALPELDTITVRLVGEHVLASPLTASGYVVAQRQASVASKGTGRLEYLGVKVGSHLAAGDILFRLISSGQFDPSFGKNGVVNVALFASVA